MESFVNLLARFVDRPVADQTGLSASYDFTLEWSPDGDTASSDAAGASLYTALQEQLGLKLESQKGRMEIVAIDHAEKPTGN